MNRDGLLQSIAETGYNVGYGAKKNFATHDIVQKVPGGLGLASLVVGVCALVWEPLNAKWIAVTMVVFGIISLTISHYEHNKVAYSEEGERLTALFCQLRDLYRDVQATVEGDDLTAYRERLDKLQADFVSSNQSKQILFSDWYAHYKFFWQHQIEWINEQKQFTFWRDKIPLSFSLTIAAATVALCIVGLFRVL